jgi:hypothetical protein
VDDKLSRKGNKKRDCAAGVLRSLFSGEDMKYNKMNINPGKIGCKDADQIKSLIA